MMAVSNVSARCHSTRVLFVLSMGRWPRVYGTNEDDSEGEYKDGGSGFVQRFLVDESKFKMDSFPFGKFLCALEFLLLYVCTVTLLLCNILVHIKPSLYGHRDRRAGLFNFLWICGNCHQTSPPENYSH